MCDCTGRMQAMVPYHEKFLVDAVEAVQQGYVTHERLDIAVAHVLQLKRRLGYLSDARLRELGQASTQSTDSDVACTPLDTLQDVPEDVKVRERAESMQAAKDGLVLVKNERDALPLEDVGEGDVVAVVGPNANSAANLLGAWSYHWQGSVEEVWQLGGLRLHSLLTVRLQLTCTGTVSAAESVMTGACRAGSLRQPCQRDEGVPPGARCSGGERNRRDGGRGGGR